MTPIEAAQLVKRSKPRSLNIGGHYAETLPYDFRVANQLHLIDLKRAGHSPSRTELAIPPDEFGGAVTIAPQVTRSLCSSSAAWD